MNINEHTAPDKLERYAFLWSILLLVVTALSLFFGVMPIVYTVVGYGGIITPFLTLSWLISGIAGIYLLYLWYKAGYRVFGKTDMKDIVMFLIMAVTGVNVGLGALGNNILMNLAYNFGSFDIIYKAVAIIYLAVAFYLFTKWKGGGQVVFGASEPISDSVTDTDEAETTVSTTEETEDIVSEESSSESQK